MTATMTFTVEERKIDNGQMKYEMLLKDPKGIINRTMQGTNREACIWGLKSIGFLIQE